MTIPANPAPSNQTARQGLMLGGAAVLCWSFSSSLIFLGAREVGTWSFVALSSLTGGVIQVAAWRWHRGTLTSVFRLPWRLWAVSVPCFVAYGLVWPAAMVNASPQDVFGVNLINYLWPVLTVLLAAWWVPGARLTGRTVAAAAVSLAGLVCANLPHLRSLLAAGVDGGAGAAPDGRLLPYGLALAAALSWAVYSATLARWRYWAGGYATSPVGFLITGAVATIVSGFAAGAAATPGVRGLLLTAGYALGPLAAGYLLWEVALARARVHALSLLAAATPVLSTLVLCVFLHALPGPELLMGAVLVSAGALLCVRD